MFVVAARLVTLAAFVAHAVLGCCAHHVHASGACEHAASSSSVAMSSGSGEREPTGHASHAHGHTGCRHHHPGPPTDVSTGTDAPTAGPPAGDPVDSDPAGPCCDEGGCSFLVTARTVLPEAPGPALAPWALVTVVECGGAAPWTDFDGGPPPVPISSAGLCVWHQSWQI